MTEIRAHTGQQLDTHLKSREHLRLVDPDTLNEDRKQGAP